MTSNSTTNFRLDVQPSAEFQTIVAAYERGPGFQEQQKKRAWDPSRGYTRFRLLPPPQLKEDFDSVEIQLHQKEWGGVEGVVIFDFQEHSVGDYLKALFNQGKARQVFLLAPEQIYLPDGSPNQIAIVEALTRCIQDTLQDKLDPGRGTWVF